jgi:hypothetical protein
MSELAIEAVDRQITRAGNLMLDGVEARSIPSSEKEAVAIPR